MIERFRATSGPGRRGSDDLQVSRSEGEYHGRRYELLFHGDGWRALAHGGAPATNFPDALEIGSNSRGDWVTLPAEQVTWWRVGVSAAWMGERVAVVGREVDGTVGVTTTDPRTAARLGIPGDQQQGWLGRAPVAELTDVEVSEEKVS